MKTTIKELRRLAIVSLVAFNLLLGATTVVAGEPTFTTIDVPGATITTAFGINPAGEIVGAYCAADFTACHGLSLLSQGSFTTIDPPGSTFTVAHGINPAGEIVGLYVDANDVGHGYLLGRSK